MLANEQVNKLRRLMELRAKRDETAEAAKKAKDDYIEAELEIFEELSEGPVSSLNNVDLGPPWGKVSFRVRETYFGRVIKGKEEEAREYFRQRLMEDALTKPKFAERRLNEIVRERLENGQPLPPGMDFYARRGLTVSRQKED